MITENDWENGYQNGTMAIVEDMGDTCIHVRLLGDGREIPIFKKEWHAIEHYLSGDGKILQRSIGTCIQFPLRLAYGITIHKSQGLTFDQITIDPHCIFVEGQLYVALSRARSLEGIRLLNQVTKRHIKIKSKQGIPLRNERRRHRRTRQSRPVLTSSCERLPPQIHPLYLSSWIHRL